MTPAERIAETQARVALLQQQMQPQEDITTLSKAFRQGNLTSAIELIQEQRKEAVKVAGYRERMLKAQEKSPRVSKVKKPKQTSRPKGHEVKGKYDKPANEETKASTAAKTEAVTDDTADS